MIGDQEDFRQRLRLTLPTRWFADAAPVLDGLLLGFAANWCGLYQFIQFVISQSRLRSATGPFLDMAAEDFLTSGLPRRPSEADDAFRERLLAALQRPGATRLAISRAGSAAGYSVAIFEAARPADTGSYNVGSTLAWNTIGAWGSLLMPLEALAVATPGPAPIESELRQNLTVAAPAGGAVWLRIAADS